MIVFLEINSASDTFTIKKNIFKRFCISPFQRTKIEDLSISITKKFRTSINHTLKKPQETSEFRTQQPSKVFFLDTPSSSEKN